MRFEPVSHDPRTPEPSATSIEPPIPPAPPRPSAPPPRATAPPAEVTGPAADGQRPLDGYAPLEGYLELDGTGVTNGQLARNGYPAASGYPTATGQPAPNGQPQPGRVGPPTGSVARGTVAGPAHGHVAQHSVSAPTTVTRPATVTHPAPPREAAAPGPGTVAYPGRIIRRPGTDATPPTTPTTPTSPAPPGAAVTSGAARPSAWSSGPGRPPAVPANGATPAPPRPRVDFAVVRQLRRELSERLTAWQRGRDFTTAEEDIERGRLAVAVVAEYADAARRAGTPMHAVEERSLLDQVTAELVGLGRLQTLLVDDTIEEVHILGCDLVRITRRGGGVDWGDPIADSDEEMVEILQAAARRAGSTERSLSTSKPTLDLQLPDGSRLAAVILVSQRPYAVIRKHNTLEVTLDELAGGRADLDEMIDPLLRDFLRAAMRAGLNIMVAGLAGAGKTTVIRALMDEIPQDEPYVLLEESRELLPARRRLRHRAVMSFESREGHGERGLDGRPAGEVTIADLIPVALRMGVLRIIVGEVRSREIVPMLQAMTTSRGSMCTIHARTPQGVGERIIELALAHGREMTVDQARRMAGNALDLIVYVTVEDETAIGGRKHRFVSHVEEVLGVGEGNRITTTSVFGPGPDGRAIPMHLPERIREQLLRVGYDVRLLSRYIEARTGAWRRPRHTRLGRHQ